MIPVLLLFFSLKHMNISQKLYCSVVDQNGTASELCRIHRFFAFCQNPTNGFLLFIRPRVMNLQIKIAEIGQSFVISERGIIFIGRQMVLGKLQNSSGAVSNDDARMPHENILQRKFPYPFHHPIGEPAWEIHDIRILDFLRCGRRRIPIILYEGDVFLRNSVGKKAAGDAAVVFSVLFAFACFFSRIML